MCIRDRISSALADIDGDNDLDIVIPNDTGMFVVDIKRPAQSIEWGCFMGTYNRAGNIYQATPATDPATPQLLTALSSNYPNPFNPSTNISFSLANPGEVSIQIFNQKGQLVKTLLNSSLPAGNHQLTWNGTDEQGAQVGSGVYFYRMKSGKYSSTRKMVMMK